MRRLLRSILPNLAALAVGVALALGGGEALVRAFWRNAPPVFPATDDPLMTHATDGSKEAIRFIPNVKGVWGWSRVSINSRGIRERPLPRRKEPGVTRVMVVGDSFIFGTGLRDEDTFPAQLERILNANSGGRRFEVINAGVPGYNLTQEIALAERLTEFYRPDIVLFSLIYNDTELKGFSDLGWTPVLDNYQRMDVPPENALKNRIYKMMIPPGRDGGCAGPQCAVARASRLYQFIALRFKPVFPRVREEQREIALFKSPVCQNEHLIWGRLSDNLGELSDMSRRRGFRPAVFFFTDVFMEGGPALRMREMIDAAGIPFFDLSPLWGGRNEYARRFSLGWDFHPNARAMKLAAETTAGILAEKKIIRADGLKTGFDPRRYDVGVKERDRFNRGELKRQLKRYDEIAAGFSDEIDFASGGFHPDQILYGWWGEEFSKTIGAPGVRWTAISASVALRNRARHGVVEIRGVMPPGPARRIFVDFNCSETIEAEAPGGREFALDFPLPEKFRDDEFLEVAIRADAFSHPFDFVPGSRDLRVLGVGVKGISLK